MLSVLLVKPWRIQQFQLPHQVSGGSREGHQPLGRRDGSAITAAMASGERNTKDTSTLQYMTRQSCAILKGASCSSQRKATEHNSGPRPLLLLCALASTDDICHTYKAGS